MKNSIQVIAIALLSFSNVVSGAIKNLNFSDGSKMVQVKMVSYADSNLLKEEIAGLQSFSNTVLDVIISDLKITENENAFITSFVTYANADLLDAEIQIEKAENTIENQIANDLKTTENNDEILEKLKFVNYSDEKLFTSELGLLRKSKLFLNELIIIDSKITEKIILIKKATNKKVAIKKAIQY